MIARLGPLPSTASWIVALAITIGLASGGIVPWVVGQLIASAGFTTAQAALVSTIEQAAQGVVMVLLAPWLGRAPARALLVGGLITLLAAQGLSALAAGVPAMAAARLISGGAFGVVYCIGAGLAAATPSPERTFAFGQTVTFVTAIGYNLMLGYGAESFGYRGVFLALFSYCALLGIPLVVLLLRVGILQPKSEVRGESRVAIAAAAPSLVAMTFFSLGTAGVWTFMERIGVGAGLSSKGLGQGLVAISVIGLVGSLSAQWIGTRWGRVLPLVVALTLLGAISFGFMSAGTIPFFWTMLALWTVFYGFSAPYVLGIAAAVDPSGRVAALSGSLYILVSAAGVSFAAWIVERAGLAAFGATAAAMCGLTLATGLLAVRRLPPHILREDGKITTLSGA